MYGENSFAEGYAIGRDSNNGYGNGMFGGDWAWWIIILLIFGWGNGGFFGGNGGGYMNGALTRGDLCQDMNFNNLESAVRGIQNGLCDGFYAQNTNMLNGFSGIQQTLCQGFSGVNSAINTSGYETRDAITALGYSLQQCCCDLRAQIKDVECQNATNTANIIAAGNANTQRLLDYLCNEKIDTLRSENLALRFGASQTAQNQFITQVGNDIVSKLNPTPVPAYPVFAPSMSFAYPTGVAFGVNGYGSGCGCGTTIQ